MPPLHMLYPLPGNPTDAGPVDSTEPPPDWSDLACYAGEEISQAMQLHRDNPAAERVLRIEALDRAETYIQAAKAHLGGNQ